MTSSLVLFYISTKCHKNIQMGLWLTEWTQTNGLSLSNITKGDNTKSKKGRVVILVHDTPSGPVLHFYQVSKQYSKRVFDLQSGHEINGLSLSNITKGDNTKSKKGRVVILVLDTSSGPVLHFCHVPSKYSNGYSSYRADTKSFSNKNKRW